MEVCSNAIQPSSKLFRKDIVPQKKGIEFKLKRTHGQWFIYDWLEEINYIISGFRQRWHQVTSQEETQTQTDNFWKGCSSLQERKYSHHSRLRRDWQPLSSVWKPVWKYPAKAWPNTNSLKGCKAWEKSTSFRQQSCCEAWTRHPVQLCLAQGCITVSDTFLPFLLHWKNQLWKP